MKKYLSILAITAVTASTFGQGTLNFVNGGTTLVRQWTSPSNTNLISSPVNGARVELAWAQTGVAYTPWTATMSPAEWLVSNPGWSLLAPAAGYANISPVAGRFSGGVLTAATQGAGDIIQAIVVGWTGASLTWNQAYTVPGAMLGVSSLFTVDTGNPFALPVAEPAGAILSSTATPFTGGVILTPVPEPSTFALAGLGAAAMLIFRRRK